MQYLTLLTQVGANKIATATANKTTIKLTQIAIGDGNGTVPMPNANQTTLVNEVYRTDLNDLKVDENNANWIVAVGYIPSNEGNFWVREVGIYDADGDLIAVGNYPETFKPVMADNVAKDIFIKMIFEVSSVDSVTLQIDPSIVLATREFVNEGLNTRQPNLISGTNIKTVNGGSLLGGGNLIIEGVLTGFVLPFSSASVPNGFLECNGALISRTAYAKLFAVIGEVYGVGDGLTTFKIPDLRGEFIRGWDNGRGVDIGRDIGTTQRDQFQGHTIGNSQGGIKSQADSDGGIYDTTRTLNGTLLTIISDGINGEPRTGAETRPRNIAIMHCIKY
ncbi:phage tail protein [Sulfurimonas sp.]|uniref:phage tail-collar fiber domain-containing protein n=1 Tax=Sulfurimonas sp. TaxID=2022749 RepID=UPI0025DFC1FD|nr:phage tail protein [Sulfurimonas sp.]